MGGPCGTYGRYERYMQGFGFGMLSFDASTCFLCGPKKEEVAGEWKSIHNE